MKYSIKTGALFKPVLSVVSFIHDHLHSEEGLFSQGYLNTPLYIFEDKRPHWLVVYNSTIPLASSFKHFQTVALVFKHSIRCTVGDPFGGWCEKDEPLVARSWSLAVEVLITDASSLYIFQSRLMLAGRDNSYSGKRSPGGMELGLMESKSIGMLTKEGIKRY